MFIQTVRVKVKPCAGNPAGVVVMNESDYLANKDAYELYDQAKVPDEVKSVEEKQAEHVESESPRRGKR